MSTPIYLGYITSRTPTIARYLETISYLVFSDEIVQNVIPHVSHGDNVLRYVLCRVRKPGWFQHLDIPRKFGGGYPDIVSDMERYDVL